MLEYIEIKDIKYDVFYKADKKSSGGRRIKRAYIKGICDYCGKEYDQLVQSVGKYYRKYCSISCNTKINSTQHIFKKRILMEGSIEQKQRAKQIVRLVIRNGVRRQKFCSYCNKQGNIEAHHPDYNKLYEWMWLCESCHKRIHHGHNIKGELISYHIKREQGAYSKIVSISMTSLLNVNVSS